jgi:hypothetical protein
MKFGNLNLSTLERKVKSSEKHAIDNNEAAATAQQGGSCR